ncbi:hypothetical protein DF3PA_150072 [Candidatus Defluviicoccus seviourii]|uniref:Uncharacterized protein n=2 Tax=root TaxID=1 RepID=A0A564WBE3_9PROT|nr:hypothetical protein DF3PB_1700006 [uncultured Defluviicoccus sp.]VUX45795.1 hypothetical protein DF3PA_150072 [Candidatus Defluviicoccus seviourii]
MYFESLWVILTHAGKPTMRDLGSNLSTACRNVWIFDTPVSPSSIAPQASYGVRTLLTAEVKSDELHSAQLS